MLDPELQYSVEASVDVSFGGLTVKHVLKEVLPCYLLIAHTLPIAPWGIKTFSVEDNENYGKDFVHSLLIAIIRVVSPPQVEQLGQQVLCGHFLEVVILLERATDVCFNQVLHLFLCIRLLILSGCFGRSKRVKVLGLLSDGNETHAAL